MHKKTLEDYIKTVIWGVNGADSTQMEVRLFPIVSYSSFMNTGIVLPIQKQRKKFNWIYAMIYTKLFFGDVVSLAITESLY